MYRPCQSALAGKLGINTGLPNCERNPVRGDAGFGITLISVVIALVMGLIMSIYLRQVATHARIFSDSYSASQSYWASLSGIAYGLYKSELGEADYGGPYTFYNSTITMDTSETTESGGSLPDYHYRIMSQGEHGNTERWLRIITKMSTKTVWGDVSIIEGDNDVEIRSGATVNDSLYIGQDVNVRSGTPIGDPPLDPTHLYIPPGASVTGGQEDAYFTTGQHSHGWLFNPDFDTEPYDSLIDIALALTSTGGNEWHTNKRFRNTSIDLNTYDDSTIFCKGKFTFQGCTITGGDSLNPAIIVAGTKVIAEKRSGTETTFGDNIVILVGDDVQMNNASEFGLDHSASDPEDRPVTLNLIFAVDYILINTNAVVWSQIYATDDIRLEGTAYGIAYAPDKFTFNKAASYLEGALFVYKFIGANGKNEVDRGQLNLNHYFYEDYFKTYDYGVTENSLYEF